MKSLHAAVFPSKALPLRRSLPNRTLRLSATSNDSSDDWNLVRPKRSEGAAPEREMYPPRERTERTYEERDSREGGYRDDSYREGNYRDSRDGGFRGREARDGPRRPIKNKAVVNEQDVHRLVDMKKRTTYGACYGCGHGLQTTVPASAGYVELAKYELKDSRRQLDQVLCERCQMLSHGLMVPGVDDVGVRDRRGEGAEEAPRTAAQQAERAAAPVASPSGAVDGSNLAVPRLLVSPDRLREDLKVIAGKRAIVLLLIDLLDASGSFFGHVRELIGGNPVFLVGTKADLLPKGTDLEDVRDWLLATAEFKRLNTIGTHITSSRSTEGIADAVSSLMRERRGRDVFVIGAANVGKSAFLKAAVKELSSASSRSFNPFAINAARFSPVESPMPGTTLSFIPIKAFDSDSAIFDTPGVHLPHRLPHLLNPDENKALIPAKRLSAYLPPIPAFLAAERRAALGEGAAAEDEGSQPPAQATYYWGGLIRLDVLEAPPRTALAFYSVSSMRVHGMPLREAENAETQQWAKDKGLFGSDAAFARGGLKVIRDITVNPPGHRGALTDIAVSGVPGWVTVFAPGGKRDGMVRIRVWAPKGIEVYTRPPMPVPNPTATAGLD